MQPADLRHCLGPSDRGEHASVSIGERLALFRKRLPIDEFGDVAALLHRHRSQARQRLSIIPDTVGAVADHEDPRLTWNRHIRLDVDATGRILRNRKGVQER
jgi:hypothetical protein